MKFISRYQKYRITLRPGIPGNAMLGNPPKEGLYVLFVDGEAIVNDEETIKLMKQHSAYKTDFICEDEGIGDPYKNTRVSNEPQHIIGNVEHGVVKNVGQKPPVSFTSEQRKAMEEIIKKGIEDGIKKEEKIEESKEKIEEVQEDTNEDTKSEDTIEKESTDKIDKKPSILEKIIGKDN